MSASQRTDFIKILTAGYGKEPKIYDVGSHKSKSQILPILCATSQDSSITVGNISHNFYFYFLGLKLKKPIPATFLYPISGLFGRYPLSGHCDTSYPPLTNFHKAYHNVERIDCVGMDIGHPLQVALAIKYLDALTRLPLDRILNLVLYETNYGKLDAIDFNAIGATGEAELATILNLGFEKFAYYDFDVVNKPEMFDRINVDWYNTDHFSKSAVHFTLKDELPPLPLPTKDIYVETTSAQQEVGLAKQVPLLCLKDRTKDRTNLEYRNWSIGTSNGLDTAMTAYFLTHILEPTLLAMQREASNG